LFLGNQARKAKIKLFQKLNPLILPNLQVGVQFAFVCAKPFQWFPKVLLIARKAKIKLFQKLNPLILPNLQVGVQCVQLREIISMVFQSTADKKKILTSPDALIS